MMVLTALTGWFVGMQSTSTAMAVNIGMSLLNVVVTLTLVYGFGIGYEGIAIGTVISQWMILIPALWFAWRLCKKNSISIETNRIFLDSKEWKQMLDVNSNLFFRSACLIALTMMLYAYSARLGDVEVSSNAVINQLFLFFSYFMDGFAFTGEALTGRYMGAGNPMMLKKSMTALLKWTFGITLWFALFYIIALAPIVRLLSDSEAVALSVRECRVWVALLPVAGALAFIYDGFYIGLTKTRPMLVATLCGVGLFAILILTLSHTQRMLWMTFTCYLALRSGILVSLFPAYSARLGDVEVSSNAVINQLFLFFSYFMDGFAFTGEALTGRYMGAGNPMMLKKSMTALLKWTFGITLWFALFYIIALAPIVRLLSDSEAVALSVRECRVWVALLPVAGALAFIYDGFYIGLTKTRPMLVATLCGVGLFAILILTLSHTQRMLWMTFTCYLALRSGILVSLFPYKNILNIENRKI